MNLDDLTPDMIENATMSDIEAIGLPSDVLAKIKECGIGFRWNGEMKRYIAEIPKPRQKQTRAKK